MRALAVFFGLLATLAGAYGGFALMREVGPGDLSNAYGREDPNKILGNLMESRNFAHVKEALERELGADGRISSLSVELLEARAAGIEGDKRISVRIDAAGRSETTEFDNVVPIGTMPISRIDVEAVDVIRKAAQKETGEPVESLTLYGGSRQWTVDMVRGEPDSFVANLDGRGLRLSGEANPYPAGGGADSMLRAKNLRKVLTAAAKEGDRVVDLTVWPERASVIVDANGRDVALDFGYDAELTSRDVRASSNRDSVAISRIDPKAIERMAKSKYVKGLKRAMYAIFRPTPIEGTPQWLLYLPEGNDPPYVTADRKGRGLTWPGRG